MPESSPPLMPPKATGRSASAITNIASVNSRASPSSVVMRSPSVARRTTIRLPRSISKSKACSGWPNSNIT